MSNRQEKQAALLVVLVIIAILAAISWFRAYHEARTYKRLTGHEVTTWDALWVELRVQEEMDR